MVNDDGNDNYNETFIMMMMNKIFNSFNYI